MSRKTKNNKDMTRGFKGWEKQYIKNSIKYGHLDDGSSKKIYSKRK